MMAWLVTFTMEEATMSSRQWYKVVGARLARRESGGWGRRLAAVTLLLLINVASPALGPRNGTSGKSFRSMELSSKWYASESKVTL